MTGERLENFLATGVVSQQGAHDHLLGKEIYFGCISAGSAGASTSVVRKVA